MKDGRTRLAHKAEHAVDLETGAVVGVSVQDADAGDTATMIETLVIAAEQVDTVQPAGTGIAELVCDKGYHSNQALVTLAAPMPLSTPCCSRCARFWGLVSRPAVPMPGNWAESSSTHP